MDRGKDSDWKCNEKDFFFQEEALWSILQIREHIESMSSALQEEIASLQCDICLDVESHLDSLGERYREVLLVEICLKRIWWTGKCMNS